LRGATHAATGLLVGVALNEMTGDTTVWLPAAAALGGLLPDIDEPRSMIAHLPGKGRNVACEATGSGAVAGLLNLVVNLVTGMLEAVTVALAAFVKSMLGHRGATHSLALALGTTVATTLAVVVLSGVAEANTGFRIPLHVGPALGLGYLSHLVTDGMTQSGVPLLWPLTKKRVRMLPKPLAVRTGGFLDWAVMMGCGAAALWMWFRQ